MGASFGSQHAQIRPDLPRRLRNVTADERLSVRLHQTAEHLIRAWGSRDALETDVAIVATGEPDRFTISTLASAVVRGIGQKEVTPPPGRPRRHPCKPPAPRRRPVGTARQTAHRRRDLATHRHPTKPASSPAAPATTSTTQSGERCSTSSGPGKPGPGAGQPDARPARCTPGRQPLTETPGIPSEWPPVWLMSVTAMRRRRPRTSPVAAPASCRGLIDRQLSDTGRPTRNR